MNTQQENQEQEVLDDNSPMKFGKHKGQAMANVPENWLRWFWDQEGAQFIMNPASLRVEAREVCQYIKDYLD